MLTFSWKNMWRNRNRTAISMSAIYFAVILSILAGSLQDGVFDNLIKNVVSFYSGYIQVHKLGYWDEQILDNSFEQSTGTENQILSQENVKTFAPRLESFALASSEDVTKGCLVIGISPEKENSITEIKDKIIKGKYLEENDQGVLLAQGLVQRLKLQLHDTLVLIGQGYHGAMAAGKYAISGIVKFGSPDLNDQALFMTLSCARQLYSADAMVTSYVLAPKATSITDLTTTAKSLQGVLGNSFEVMTWEEMMPDVIQHIKTDKASMYIIQGILYLLICFGIFGTLLMMMVERRFEMGMLVAIGMKKIKLIQLLLVESVLTVFTGCVLGILTSIPIVYYLNKYPLRFKGDMAKAYEEFGFEPIFPAAKGPDIFLSQGFIVLAIGLILALYPIVKIIQLNPVTAMKK